MNLNKFFYDLPQDLIAQSPVYDRDKARLMVVDRKLKKIRHDYFYNIGKYLPESSVLVRNNSKVIPARLLGTKERSGGKVEIFILKKRQDGSSFEVLMKRRSRIKNGDKIIFEGSSVVAEVLDVDNCIVKFNKKDIFKYLDKIGHIPLPPYIRRSDTKKDREFYQTVYARHKGSVASPTAGLHFTKPLIVDLKKEGHEFLDVTLHINYATFKPVEEADIREHKMHHEDYSISRRTVDNIEAAKSKGRKVVSVGTTSARVLESAANNGKLKGSTNLFIYPGYKFKVVDVLITNFHLPYSSLLMLVYALGSGSLMKRAYSEAIKMKYRFYSYGDGMIIV